jgi:BlaI family transcriptional regulator, penicillinase repressor
MPGTIVKSKPGTRVAEIAASDWAIIKVVWELEPCSAGTVQEYLHSSRKWAYSTVKTLMERMVKKGFLSSKKTKNVTRYSATISENDAKRLEIAKTAKRAFDDDPASMVKFMLENTNLPIEKLDKLRKTFIHVLSNAPK